MNNKCRCGFLEEIDEFKTLGEYEKFMLYLKRQVQKKNLEEVETDENYEKGLIYGGKWYRCIGCKKIWRLIPPDFPFKGLWEKVDS